ncbi:MAG: NACHT domain-containing protein [Actinomadura sp.]
MILLGLLVAAAVGLLVALIARGVSDAADWAQLLSLVLALPPVLVIVISLISTRGNGVWSTEQVKAAQYTLGTLVLEQWSEEISIRQLDDPAPLSVQWRLTTREVMDHPEHISAALPVVFEGSTDHIQEIARQFRELRRRRLIVLGEPGMGKTTLAVLLMRELLVRPEPDDRTPVMLSMAEWSPDREPFKAWLARRLREVYPALCAADFGPDGPWSLVSQGRILPILDGLDELPAEARPKVIHALNADLADSDQLILTCRTAEYAEAVAAPGGDVLTGDLVLEPLPLRPGDTIDYLTHCLPPRPSPSWREILATLEAEPAGPLSSALFNPLNLWLTRKVYIETGTDPAPLADRARFPDADAVNHHLLDHLVGSLITANRSCRWRVEDADRWLGFLAVHMSGAATRDMTWWTLHRSLPRRAVSLAAALTLGLPVGGLLAGVTLAVGSSAVDLGMAVVLGLVSGTASALVFAVAAGLTSSPDAEPAYANLRLRGRSPILVRQLVLGFVIGSLVGACAGLITAIFFGIQIGLALGLILGYSLGLVGAIADFALTPQPNDRPQSPPAALRRDANLAVVRKLTAELIMGPAAGAAGAVVLLATDRDRLPWGYGIVAAMVIGGAIGLIIGFGGGLRVLARPTFNQARLEASVIYLVTVTWLWSRRRAPFRLMRLLDEAHRLGILRQAGRAYQFRHANLQDRLADTHGR